MGRARRRCPAPGRRRRHFRMRPRSYAQHHYESHRCVRSRSATGRAASGVALTMGAPSTAMRHAGEETAMTVTSGAAYAPAPMPSPVVGPGEFVFAAVRLDHGHIYGMSEGLVGAGGTLKWVYDPDPAKVDAFRRKFPEVRAARSEEEIFDDPAVRLVAGAAVTSER